MRRSLHVAVRRTAVAMAATGCAVGLAVGWSRDRGQRPRLAPAAGVIAAGTYDNSGAPNETYLFDASDGALLAQLDQGNDFPQGAFATGCLYTASSTGLYAWAP